jgi:broad specificity phosphatase PhoE
MARLVRSTGLVVAVCHGGVIEQTLLQSMGLPAAVGPGVRVATVPNASISEWTIAEVEGAAPRWRLVRFCDAAHVAALRDAAEVAGSGDAALAGLGDAAEAAGSGDAAQVA